MLVNGIGTGTGGTGVGVGGLLEYLVISSIVVFKLVLNGVYFVIYCPANAFSVGFDVIVEIADTIDVLRVVAAVTALVTAGVTVVAFTTAFALVDASSICDIIVAGI